MLVRINTLHSLENVKDIYSFDTERLAVVNTETGYDKTISKLDTGYPAVYLETKVNNGKKTNMAITMHKIVALACIENKESYRCIEHLDDNKDNYHPSNLLFSTQSMNARRAFKNGRRDITLRTFRVTLKNGEVFEGPLKDVAKECGISKATLYDLFLYRGGYGKRVGVESIVVTGQQTIERYGADAV